MSVHKILNSLGLQEISGLLIKRGTALGPLVPTLLISLVLLIFSWLFKSTLVIGVVPLITVACVLVAFCPIIAYILFFAWFAKHDPDRLQSEEYRLEEYRLLALIEGKELPGSVSEGEIPLADTVAKLSDPEASKKKKIHLLPPTLTRNKPYESLSLDI